MTIVGKEGLGVPCLDWSTHVTKLQLQAADGLHYGKREREVRLAFSSGGFLFTLPSLSSVPNIDNGPS